jgi:transcriptional regulator with XRE-family HTH domain
MARKKKSLNGAKTRVFLNYRHTGQDPVVGLLKSLRDSSELSEKEIGKRHGLAKSTPKGWFTGKVRNPQHKTMAEYAGVFGKRFVLEDANSTAPVLRGRKSR